MPKNFGFDVLDLGEDEGVAQALRNLLAAGHEIQIRGPMNNGNLQAIVTPEIEA